jgi:NAD(P)H-flavin reductase
MRAEPAPSTRTDVMVPRVAEVVSRRRESGDVVTLELVAGDGLPIACAPGQFNMLTVFGVGEAPISVSGATGDPRRVVHTIRAVGPVSAALTRLKAGAMVGVRGPFGNEWPLAEAAGRDVVVMAGGLGLAPLRPVMLRLVAERERYGSVTLLYGTRNPEAILFRRDLEAWSSRLDVDVEVTVDFAASGWRGHVGMVPALVRHAAFDPGQTTAMVCGPEVMMRFSAAALVDAGVPAGDVHLSMERSMKCAAGFCGHCQFGPVFICRDGAVFRYDAIRDLIATKEV